MARRPAPAQQVVVLGLGRFGSALALELESDGVEVIGIDANPKLVQSLAGELTHVVVADTTDEEAMRQLGVQECDRAVIAIGSSLEASVLTAFVLQTLGITDIWAKAQSAAQAQILRRLGVGHVVRPEHDTGRRVAHLLRGRMMDYIEFDDGYAIVKTSPPASIVGQTLGQSMLRSRHGVTIVGVKRPGQDFTHATPETYVDADSVLIVSGPEDKVEAFSNAD